MKKLIVTLALVASLTTFAQQEKHKGDDKPRKSPEEMATNHSERLKKDLNLTDAQTAQIKDLAQTQLNKNQNAQEARKEKMKEMKQGREENKANNEKKMKEILTPEQYQKWETMRDNKMDKMKEKRADKKQGKRRLDNAAKPAPTE